MLRHFVPSRWLHPLATFVRLSPVDLPSANSMKCCSPPVSLKKKHKVFQEALAEFVGTTRQAISKWENNQGYPEIEKLLLLSNVFEVSIDFLLKDEKTESSADEKGYYVSREMAVGYIANEKKTCKYFGAGFALFALAGIPYTVFQTTTAWKVLGMSICILAGIIAHCIHLDRV